MIMQVFNKAMPWATQKEMAMCLIEKLKASPKAECSTVNYSSSKALAAYILGADAEKRVQTVEIYSTFVRLVRNDDTKLPFGAVIMDFVRYPKQYQDDHFRP